MLTKDLLSVELVLPFVDAPCGFQALLRRFTIELVARVCLHGRRFFCSDDWLWNWLDIAIVASSFVPCDVFSYFF